MWLATPKSNLECVHWEECAGISLQELTGENGDPSIHTFPGNLPPSSPPQICLASGCTRQPHQRCKEVGWWHCFSGLGSPCPRHSITSALKTNPVRTSRYQSSCTLLYVHRSCFTSSASNETAAHVQSKKCRCPVWLMDRVLVWSWGGAVICTQYLKIRIKKVIYKHFQVVSLLPDLLQKQPECFPFSLE